MRLSQAVKTTLNYYPTCSLAERQIVLGTVGAYRRPIDSRPITVQDVRGRENNFSLDVHGFQFLNRPSPHVSSFTESVVKKFMYPEAVDILKKAYATSFPHHLSSVSWIIDSRLTPLKNRRHQSPRLLAHHAHSALRESRSPGGIEGVGYQAH